MQHTRSHQRPASPCYPERGESRGWLRRCGVAEALIINPFQALTIRMHGKHSYYVYIMTNPSHTVLYVGVTNNLKRRVHEHKHKLVEGFTSKYNVTYLVYYEETSDVRAAIAREKQIKGWVRARKVALIEASNPAWRDLSADWFFDD